jgi:hypothetical protein
VLERGAVGGGTSQGNTGWVCPSLTSPLPAAFGRRAMIEQAKGILMARHSINADKALERLRDHSQHNGRKLSDVAAAAVESHLLLLPPAPQTPHQTPVPS